MVSLVIDLFRLARAGFVMVREGVLRFVPQDDMPPAVRLAVRVARSIERGDIGEQSRADRLSAAFARLGPSYVKLGQFLATRPDVVGQSVARDLERLQDRLPPFPVEQARTILQAAFSRNVDDFFGTLQPAVAAASIAQVHKVRLADGRDVAVKVLRPDVSARFYRDLRAYFTAAHLIERCVPSARRLDPVGVVRTLADSVRLEMDLRLEAAALSELAENTRDDDGFRLPGVDWHRTVRNVLTTDWIDGIPLSDTDRLRREGHDLPGLGRAVIQHFLRHAMRDGFFHADMHQGNLFVDSAGRLVAVDCGIMGRLDQRERRFLATILYSFITRDYRRGAQAHFEAGYVPRHQSVATFAQALRAIGEPIHQKTADEISMARLLAQLLEYTQVFEMRTRLELILLQKTMVVVEGVGRSLDPKLDMWKTAEPVVREWMAHHLGPRGGLERVGETARQLVHLASESPEILMRVQSAAEDWLARREAPLAPPVANEPSRLPWLVALAAIALAALAWWR